MSVDSWVMRTRVTEPSEVEEIRAILTECDRDFVPPLSARKNTSQRTWVNGGSVAEGVTAYAQAMLGQCVLLWKRDGATVGFLSFIPDYDCPVPPRESVCYLSTLCVRHAERGQGLALRLYAAMLDYARQNFPGRAVVLRTWSTNAAQLHLMAHLGFSRIATLKDDRGPGVDTVYFRKVPEPSLNEFELPMPRTAHTSRTFPGGR